MKFSNVFYNINTIVDMIKVGEIKFDNPVQRGFVWKKNKKSLLIHSVVVGYPIDVIYSNKIGRILDILDGQQRLTSISQYVNGLFKLSEMSPVLINGNEIEDLTVLDFNQMPMFIQEIIKNYDEYKSNESFKNKPFKSYPQKIKDEILKCNQVINISGKSFNELPEIIQQTILDYRVDLHYVDNLSQSQIAVLFDRLNNGKPLTPTEKAKAQILSPQAVERLRSHKIFTAMLSEDAIIGKASDTYIMQAYIVLFSYYDKSLLGSKIEKILSTEEITKDKEQILMSCFDIYLKAINTYVGLEGHMGIKLRRSLKARSHFASLLPVVEMVVKDKMNIENFISWLYYFFDTPVGTSTVSSEYNSKLNDAGNSHTSVSSRITSAKSNFLEYLKNIETIIH